MIRTVTIENPPFNTLTIRHIQELVGVIRSVQPDERVVVIRGGGEHFSAGMDVGQRLPGRGGEEALDSLEELFTAVEDLAVPTISVVWGSCLGVGLELAASCDFMVVADTARLGFPEVRLGVIPAIAVARLPRRIDRGRAADLLLTGREFDGLEAERIGLATMCCSDPDVKARAADLAQRLAAYSPAALRMLKKALRETDAGSASEAAAKSLRFYREQVLHSPEAIEGLTAHIEKREPKW